MNSNIKPLMALIAIAVLLIGCQDEQRRRQAEQKARRWQDIAAFLGAIALVSLGVGAHRN